MPSYFTIFCSTSVRHIGVPEIVAALDAVDLPMVAEGFGIEDEEAVEAAVSGIRVSAQGDARNRGFQVHFEGPNSRPIVVSVAADPARVQEEVAEMMGEHLDGRNGPGATKARTALAKTLEVVSVELGIGQIRGLGLVIAGQVAEYFAQVGDGVIRDARDEWWVISGGRPTLLPGVGNRS